MCDNLLSLTQEVSPPGSTPERCLYVDYDILLFETIHTILITRQRQSDVFFLRCSPSEYLIFVRFLHAPVGFAVPYEELWEVTTDNILRPLQRHVSRLKKKLPPGWSIVCEIGFGYRLQVSARAPLSSPPLEG